MAATQVGRILLMPKGTYNASTTYNMLDWVRYSGEAWVCKVDGTVGITPVEGANWTLMASDGSAGGWSSLAGKPFDTVGDGLAVDSVDPNKPLYVDTGNTTKIDSITKKLEVVAKNTYVGTGTSSDRPISGQGVADALTTVQDGTTINTFSATETALSGKADDNDLDEWVTGTGSGDNMVNSSGVITFTGINDTNNDGYDLYLDIADGNPPVNPSAQMTFLYGTGTSSMSVTYQTNCSNGTTGKLRRLK